MVTQGGNRGDVLGPAVAGTWYPADRLSLEHQLDGFFRETKEKEEPRARVGAVDALIAPHAGFVYSGRVAAAAFGRLGDRALERVILLGPSHYEPFDGAILPGATSCRTPLGEVPIDTEAAEALAEADGFRVHDRPFRPEHSLEAEIPFLQRGTAPGWRLLPVLVGMLGSRVAPATIADGLRPLLGPGTLVVVSSDFTHYGPRFEYVPFKREVEANLKQLDRGAIDRILAGDGDGFEAYVAETGATICGRNPIRVLLDLLPDGTDGELAAYDTSGRLTGEWDHSVSYAGLVFRASRT